MFQNKGFTLIEMLLVISIILTLSVLSFPFMKTKTIYITDECVKKQIGMIINQAKSKAIISHEKVSLIVSKQEISFIDHQKKYKVVLPNNYFFNNIKEIYFVDNTLTENATLFVCADNGTGYYDSQNRFINIDTGSFNNFLSALIQALRSCSRMVLMKR